MAFLGQPSVGMWRQGQAMTTSIQLVQRCGHHFICAHFRVVTGSLDATIVYDHNFPSPLVYKLMVPYYTQFCFFVFDLSSLQSSYTQSVTPKALLLLHRFPVFLRNFCGCGKILPRVMPPT